ncbi:hypothetical protein PMAYCL1PPCAC_24260, partial [Pristionchus mayeri]
TRQWTTESVQWVLHEWTGHSLPLPLFWISVASCSVHSNGGKNLQMEVPLHLIVPPSIILSIGGPLSSPFKGGGELFESLHSKEESILHELTELANLTRILLLPSFLPHFE